MVVMTVGYKKETDGVRVSRGVLDIFQQFFYAQAGPCVNQCGVLSRFNKVHRCIRTVGIRRAPNLEDIGRYLHEDHPDQDFWMILNMDMTPVNSEASRSRVSQRLFRSTDDLCRFPDFFNAFLDMFHIRNHEHDFFPPSLEIAGPVGFL
jgi:hypothetical protein